MSDDTLNQKTEEEKRQRREEVLQRREEQRKKILEKEEPIIRKRSEISGDEEESILRVSSQVPSEPTIKPSLREDVIASAVGFLRNENIKTAPKDKKVAFLQKKGLTNEEIQEAFSRAEQSSGSAKVGVSSPVPPSPPSYPSPSSPLPPPGSYGYPVGYPIPPPQSREWYATKSGLALTAITCLGVGVGVSYLAQKYFSSHASETKEMQFKLIKEKEEKEKERENKVLLEGLTSTLKSIENQNAEMKMFLSSLTEQRSSAPTTSVPSTPTGKSKREVELEVKLQEQQSQIENLRTLMMDQKSLFTNPVKSPWIPPSSPSLPSWQTNGSTAHQSFEPKKKEQETSFDEMMKQKESDVQSTSSQFGSKFPEKDNTPYPHSFSEIASMVSKGQPIPGVRTDIDDKPLDPNAKLEKGPRDPVQKPWESKTSVVSPSLKEMFSDIPPKIEEVAENNS